MPPPSPQNGLAAPPRNTVDPRFGGTERYRPLRLLGQGGMGAVYEVEDLVTGGHVALKVMLRTDPRELLRFKQEFRVMAEIHHPNLVRLFELGCEDGQWFYTMELIEGQNVLELLRDEPDELAHTTGDVPETESPHDSFPTDPRGHGGRTIPCDIEVLTAIFAQILDALEALHGAGFVHRDLKPANILVDLHGVVRLLDFGLVCPVDRDIHLSAQGTVIGTPAYMSPEQSEGLSPGPPSDLYGLGCILFQLLTGRLPFTGTAARVTMARLTSEAPDPARYAPDAPTKLLRICHAMLSRRPEERPTIAQIRCAFDLLPCAEPDASPPAIPFLGRSEELQQLEHALQRVEAGSPQSVVVLGASGVGKSTLAARLREMARARGFTAFSGRCYEREHVPFVAFDRVLDELTVHLAEWSSQDLAEISATIAELGAIFPALGLLGPLGPPPGPSAAGDPLSRAQRAFHALVRLLEVLQHKHPVLLVLDDLQWADEDSIALLGHVLARTRGRVCVLILARPEPQGSAPFFRLLAASSMPLLELQPLSQARTVELVERLLPPHHELGQETLNHVADLSEGNAFLAVQLATYLRQTGANPQVEDLLTATRSPEHLLRDMLDALQPDARSVLDITATAGGDVDEETLRRVSGLPAHQFSRAITELTAANLLGVARSRRGGLRVDARHDRVREEAYACLSPERRVELHRDLATELERQGDSDHHDIEALLAHWTAAGQPTRWRRLALEAADAAEAQLAFVRAAELLRLANRDLDAEAAPLKFAERWERIGRLHELGGQPLEASEAYQRSLALLQSTEPGPDTPIASLRLRTRIGECLMAGGRVSQSRSVFASALDQIGLQLERPLLHRVLLLLSLQVQIAFAGLRRHRASSPLEREKLNLFNAVVRSIAIVWPELGLESSLRGELLGQLVGDHSHTQRALASRAMVTTFVLSPTPRRIAQGERSLDLSERIAIEHAIPHGLEIVRTFRGMLHLPTNLERAAWTLEDAVSGLEEQGLQQSIDGALARTALCVVSAFAGHHDRVRALRDEGLRQPVPQFINHTLMTSALIRVEIIEGNLAAAEAALAQLDAHLEHVPLCALTTVQVQSRCAVLVAQGRFGEVLEELRRHRRVASRLEDLSSLRRSLNWMCEIGALLGLLREGSLTSKQQRALKRIARQLLRTPLLDAPAIGLAALGQLAAARHPARARTLARRAILASRQNTPPIRRWFVLRVAVDLGEANSDDRAELERLQRTHRIHPGIVPAPHL